MRCLQLQLRAVNKNDGHAPMVRHNAGGLPMHRLNRAVASHKTRGEKSQVGSKDFHVVN